jgi:hypothetical protein
LRRHSSSAPTRKDADSGNALRACVTLVSERYLSARSNPSGAAWGTTHVLREFAARLPNICVGRLGNTYQSTLQQYYASYMMQCAASNASCTIYDAHEDHRLNYPRSPAHSWAHTGRSRGFARHESSDHLSDRKRHHPGNRCAQTCGLVRRRRSRCSRWAAAQAPDIARAESGATCHQVQSLTSTRVNG